MKKHITAYLIKIILFLSLILGAFIISRNYFQFALIQGNSMEPAYHSMELVIINKYDTRYHYDDTVAFFSDGVDSTLVKRIVALPNDTIEIRDHKLYINDILYTSDDCRYDSIDYAGIANNEITLASDTYFVLGDNLSESKDSRYPSIGCIHTHDIIGKVYPIFPIH